MDVLRKTWLLIISVAANCAMNVFTDSRQHLMPFVCHIPILPILYIDLVSWCVNGLVVDWPIWQRILYCEGLTLWMLGTASETPCAY